MQRARLGMLTSILLLTQAAASAGDTSEADQMPRFGESIEVLGQSIDGIAVPADKAFEVDFRVGDLDIEARPVTEAQLELRAGCREIDPETCQKRLAKARISTEDLGDRVRVRLRGLSRRAMRKLDVLATIVVPSRAPLIVRMGIGDLDVAAGPEDLDVAMGIGDLTVRVARDDVARVWIATRIGDASLRGNRSIDGRRRFLGARVDWREGRGDASIDVKLKIGDAKVYLE